MRFTHRFLKKKSKKISPHERSTCQIISKAEKNDGKDEISKLPFKSKTHSILKKKTYVSLYKEDLYFLTKRAGWKITKIYYYYTFKQDTFKRDFVAWNQNARKTAKTSVKKDFYKLLNSSNFGNDCRNNIANCKLELIYDGLEGLKYIKNYNSFDDEIFEFFSTDLLRENLNNEFQEQIQKLHTNDPYYFSILENITEKYERDLAGIERRNRTLKKKKAQNKNYQINKIIQKIEERIKACDDLRKNRMILEFNDAQSSAIKSIAVKNETNIKCTTRFMSGKLLMFAKISLKSFIYSLVELLYFPDENSIVLSIYNKYNIEKIHCYHILTDTDSKAIQFVIISNIESTYPEKKVHENFYEIFSCTEIVNRFDTSDEYWKRFNVCWPNNKKKH